MISKILKQILRKKLIIGIGLMLIITGGYFGYRSLSKDDEATHYVMATVENGTLIVSISGSGQVLASDQVDIKSKVSGDVVYVGAENGQEVEVDTLLVQIDDHKAQKEVDDVETALETAKLELEELLQPADNYSLMQTENALIQAKDSLTKLIFTQESNYQNALDAKQKAKDNLEETYEDVFNAVTDAFLDLPTLITGLRDILYSHEIAESEVSISNYSSNLSALKNSVDYDDRDELEKFINGAESNYKTARANYDESFENYKDTNRYADKETIEALLEETLETVRAMAETVKSETNMTDYWVDYQSRHDRRIYAKVIEHQSNMKSYTSKTNSHLSSLLSAQRSIEDDKEAQLDAGRDLIEMAQNQPLDLAAAERSVQEKEEALARLKANPDELDVRAKKIAVQQKEDALLDAKQTLLDHYIRAFFDGVIASIDVKKGESVSSNTVATLITKQKVAKISLNEIDVVKVKMGQKATITFDAIDDLTITGEVVEIDALGEVNQGVVTYNVKIAFNTQDERVRPGMSTSVAIITDAKQNVLMVLNAAIKYKNDTQYVEILSDNNTIIYQQVEIGISNDMYTEIVSGLEEGEKVVSSQTTSSSGSNSGGGFEGPGSGMNVMRMMR